MQQQCLKDPNKDIGLDFGLDLDLNLKLGVWSEDKEEEEARGKHQLMPNECNNSASRIQIRI